MTVNDSVLQSGERAIFSLRELYAEHGYTPYRMNKFEEYDLYARNKDFLVSDSVITFTDTTGKLMALKPDVTLSIVKNNKDIPGETQKVYYNENVYRISKGTHTYKEIKQAGLECLGLVDDDCICEVIGLAAESMRRISESYVLGISNLDIIESVIGAMGISDEACARIYKFIGEKNTHELAAFCAEKGVPEELTNRLRSLMSIQGKVTDVLGAFEDLAGEFTQTESYKRFIRILTRLAKSGATDELQIDFSIVSDTNYYNGIVFKGFVRDVPNAVLSGGQYDKLMRKMQKRSDAIGFAVYLDELDRVSEAAAGSDEQMMLNVALPKGRLGEKVYEMFEQAGFECPAIMEPNRKLIFENPDKGVRYFWVKPSDVAIYVERGAADIGVAGKDILLEYEPDLYELLDLDMGKCRMAVAAPKGYEEAPEKTLRVATKFTNIARNFYMSKGRDIDIIHLNGSIEIAPILGLSDVIVDIVETGTTLRENDLEVVEDVVPISARLIANKSSMQFKSSQIGEIARSLAALTEDKK